MINKVNSPLIEVEDKSFMKEWIGIVCLIIFSFINSTTLLISLMLLLFLIKQKEIGALKIINLIVLRTIINPGIAVEIEKWQILKWIILISCSLYLVRSYNKMNTSDRNKIRSIIIMVLLFGIYNSIVALFIGSLPVISIFKLFSYILVFLGVLIGVGNTIHKFNWTKWMLQLFMLLCFSSFFTIPIPLGYLRNGHSFQGITNQPNMLGIVLVLLIAVFFSYTQTNNFQYKILLILLPTATIYMIILSKSRTAFVSFILLGLIYMFFYRIKPILKVIIVNFLLSLLITTFLWTDLPNFLNQYFSKGNQINNLLYSRMDQISVLLNNFNNSPFFGNGFAVPVLPFRSFQFKFNFVVEPGNLIIAVLSYSGIFGFIIFISYILNIFWINKRNFKYICFLPLAVLFVNMGEMVFFSTNNIGIWCYMFLAIYVFQSSSIHNG